MSIPVLTETAVMSSVDRTNEEMARSIYHDNNEGQETTLNANLLNGQAWFS